MYTTLKKASALASACIAFAGIAYLAIPSQADMERRVSNLTFEERIERVNEFEARGEISQEEAERARQELIYSAKVNGWVIEK